MVSTSSTDLGTLGWVKDEIDETLKQARLALEAFSEHRADEAKLRLCATYLHQVGGTLKMVELDPLARLVGEAEASVQALLQGVEAPSEAVLEPLARVLLSLPDILDRVEAQGLGNGLLLLPLANELRLGRGEVALGAREFFAPDLSARPPVTMVGDDHQFSTLFRKQRPLFQKALLKWLKEPRSLTEGKTMSDLIATWRDVVAFAPLAQCLWVATAFLRFVTEQAAPPVESKKLIGRLDQLLKRFVDGKDKGGLRTACERLTRDMLFGLREGPSTDNDVAAIRSAFGLAGEPQNVSGPSVSALRSIATALSSELAHAQGLLSRCFDPGQEAGGVPPDGELLHLLDKMGKTLSTLNILPLQALVHEAAEVCRAVGEGRLEKSGAVAMALAQALLQTESATREIPFGRDGWQLGVEERRQALANLGGGLDTSGVEVSEAPLSEQDRRQLVGAVGGEIRANLRRIEEGFLAFVAAPADRELLTDLPALATQVEAAFRVVEDEAAANLAHGLYDMLERFARGALAPRGIFLETLAAAVAGLEAQVAGLERGRALPEAQLLALTSGLQSVVAGTGGESRPLSESEMTLSSYGSRPLAVGAYPTIDPEILPVFLEDARQAVAQLEEALPAWTTDIADEQAVGLARRAFHTLKGSGRMVEAGEIAELAYDAETLLNKIRSRQLALGPDSLKWITAAYQAVCDWIEALEQGRVLPNMAPTRAALRALAEGCSTTEVESRAASAPSTQSGRIFGWEASDGESLMSTEGSGNAIAKPPVFSSESIVLGGEEQGAVVVPHAEDSLDPIDHVVGVVAKAGSISPLANDPLLHDIFVAETQDHLTVLRRAITSGPAEPVSGTLLRAAHTMQGSARSVGLAPMAEACAGLERYLQALELRQESVGTEGIELLSGLVAATETSLRSLRSDSYATPDFAALTARLMDLTKETTPASELTWWQKNLELQESVRDDEKAGVDVGPVGGTQDRLVRQEQEQILPETGLAGPVDTLSTQEAAAESIDPELRGIFRDEAHDLLDAFEGALEDWRGKRQSDDPLRSLKRVLHTLKGGARMCGVFRMGAFAHATEELLRRVEDGSCPRDDDLFALLDLAAEQLGVLYNDFLSGQSTSEVSSEQSLLVRLRGEISEVEESAVQTD